MAEGRVYADNTEAAEAWNGVLFDVWLKYRQIIVREIAAHSDLALAKFPPPVGGRVLDFGCGLGETTKQIAALVGPDGHAHGIDVGSRFIDFANEEAEREGVANVEYSIIDVETEDLGGPYDYAFSRFGSMFFAGPVPALRNVRSSLEPGARLVTVVWRAKHYNEWMFRAEQVANKYLEDAEEDEDEPTCGPGPFSMANADTVSDILKGAGFVDIELVRSDQPYRFGETMDTGIDLLMALGPAAEVIRLAGDAADEVRPQMREEMREVLADYSVEDGGVVSPSSTWVISAINPG